MAQIGDLQLENSIGFEGTLKVYACCGTGSEQSQPTPVSCGCVAGSIHGGVVMHPDGRHLIYSLGGTIVVRTMSRPQDQSFLQGHTNNVSCLACSSSGAYLASGQSTHMGFKVNRPWTHCV